MHECKTCNVPNNTYTQGYSVGHEINMAKYQACKLPRIFSRHTLLIDSPHNQVKLCIVNDLKSILDRHLNRSGYG